jgi:TP901 family phage tail tape measure protein
MPRGVFNVGINFVSKGVSRVSGQIRSLGTSMGDTAKTADATAGSFRSLAGAFTGLIVARRAAGVLRTVMKPVIEMEFAMKKLAVQLGRGGEHLKQFREAADAAAKATTFGPQQAVEALVQLTRATGDASKASGVLKHTMGLTQLSFGGLDPKRAAKDVGMFLKSFNLVTKSAKEQQLALDKLYTASVKGGLEIEELTKVSGLLGAAAMRGNQSMEDIISSFIIARKVLPSSRRAATALFRVFGELAKPKAQQAFARLGISVQDAVTGRIVPASKLFTKLAHAYQEDAGNVRMAIGSAFGEAAIKPMIAIIEKMNSGVQIAGVGAVKGAAAFTKLREAMSAGKGSIEKGLTEQMRSAKGAIDQVGNAWDKFLEQVGSRLMPVLMPVLVALRDMLEWAQNFMKTMGPVGNFFSKLVIRMAVFRVALFVIKSLFFGLTRILAVTRANVIGLTGDTARNTGATAQNTIAQTTNAAAVRAGSGSRAAAEAQWLRLTAATNANTAATGRAGVAMAGATGTGMMGRLGGMVAGFGRLGGVLRGVATAARGLFTAVGGWVGIVLMLLPEILSALGKIGSWISTKITTPMGNAFDRMNKGFAKTIDMSKDKSKIKAFSTTPQDMKLAEGRRRDKQWISTAADDAMAAVFGWAGWESKTAKIWKAADDMQAKINQKTDAMYKKNIERYKKIIARQHKAAEMMVLGTAQFDKASERLKALFGHKPQVVKQSSINKMATLLTQIQQKGKVGGVFIRPDAKGRRVGVKLNEGDAARAGKAIEGLQQMQGILARVQRGEKVKGVELLQMKTNLFRAMNTVQQAAPQDSKQREKFMKEIINPIFAQLGPAARKVAGLTTAAGGGKHLGTGAPIQGYDPYHGRTFGSLAKADAMKRVGRPELGFELGGSQGLPGKRLGYGGLRGHFPKGVDDKFQQTFGALPQSMDKQAKVADQQLKVLKSIESKLGGGGDGREYPWSQPMSINR